MIRRPGSWIAILLIIMAFASGILYLIKINNEPFSEEIIYDVSEKFRPKLKLFLDEAQNTINKLKTDVLQVNVDALPVESLNQYFSDLTGKNEILYGVVLFGDNMNYVIFRDQNSWIYTYNNLQDSIINWQRIDENLLPIPNGSWTETKNNFLNERNFGQLEIAQLVDEEYIWAGSKSTLPDRQDLLLNIFRLDSENDFDIAALIYKTSEIGTRFSGALRFENLLVSVITEKDNVVSPIRTQDTAMISRFRILETKVGANLHLWRKTFFQQPHTFWFDEFNMHYFSRFDTISPQLGVKAFAITISESDLKNSKKRDDETFLYLALLLALFALFFFLNTLSKHKKQIGKKTATLRLLTVEEIKQLISKGETEHTEFKSSLRWDYKEEKVNKVLEDVIIKSIAAFANAKGGILFIGVNDDMEIIGLEPDFKTLKKQDADYFELHLRKMINNQYGIKFSNRYLQIQFPKIGNQVICVIQIMPSNRAMFMKTKNRQGQEVEKFYVRSGNASQEIASLSEINEYIKERFDLFN